MNVFDRTQGYDYFPRLAKEDGNVLYNADDGTVWACYHLTGINFTPYDLDTVTACQRGNARLLTALSYLPAGDFLLAGFKGQTDPDEIMARCSAGIPNLTSENYPELREQFDVFHRKLTLGERAEHSREAILCIGFPTRQSQLDKLFSSLGIVNPHRTVNPDMIAELEPRYFKALPPEFSPRRIHADHVRWAFDRARLRGITVPIIPPANAQPRLATPGPRSFAPIVINKFADTDALYEDFLRRARNADPQLISRGSHRVPWLPIGIAAAAGFAAAALNILGIATTLVTVLSTLTVAAVIAAGLKTAASANDSRKMLRDSFPSTRWSRAISVHNPSTRSTTEFPDGYTSYQTQVAIAGYPTTESFEINALTAVADQEIGVDADWAIRFDFSQDHVTKRGWRRRRKELDAEDMSNTEDELDAEEYAEKRGELRALRAAAKSEPGPRGMRAVTVFSFAHQNLEKLNKYVDDTLEYFVEHDFTPLLPVGAQFDVWQAMMPGSSCPPVLEDLKQITTTRLFGALMPVRRIVAGDPVGMPIGVNKENALGQIIHRDLLYATDRGNASMAVIGAPNGGKSQLMKVIAAFMVDLKRPVHMVDQDPDGEGIVFAYSITDPQIIHVTEPEKSIGGGSLDPLKCYPPEQAAGEFLRLWLPLLKIDRRKDAEKASLLAKLVSPDFRASAHIHSTRDLVERLRGGEGGIAHIHAGPLAVGFDFWAQQPYTAAFIDPVVEGRVVNYPPFNPHKLLVVFATPGLKVARPNPGNVGAVEETDEELFAAMAFTAIARLTAWRFYNTPGPCLFLGDELRFFKGSRVLQDLVEQPDRMGRKGGNWVFVAAQLAGDLDEHTGAIECKIALRQGTQANARAALAWEELPVTERLVKRMVEDTSPLDPVTRMPAPDRRGEGWYNDGVMKVRVQFFDHLLARRRRFSNTEASSRIRAQDLPALVGAGEPRP